MSNLDYTNRCVRSQSSIACVQHVRYTSPVPKGMVTQKHQSLEVAAPTYKRGFVMPKLSGPVRLHASVQWLRGVVGHIRKDCRTATDVFLTTTLHPMRSKTQTVVSCLP